MDRSGHGHQPETSGPRALVVDAALSPAERLETWRQAVGAVFDLEGVEAATFDCGMRSWNLGSLVLGQFWSTGNRFVRNRAKVAQSGLDHYLVQILTSGASTVRAGAPEGDWPLHSVRMLDMTREIETEARAFSNLTLILPRSALEPLLGAPFDLHGLTLASGSSPAAVLGGFMRTLADRADGLSAAEAEAMGQGAAALVASCFGPSAAGRDRARGVGAVANRAVVQAWIETRLGDPSLDAEAIAAQFGLSRATLYRLFEPLGGVAAYVRERRLDRAFRALRAAGAEPSRVSRIAAETGFRNLSSFSRDFRARFGAANALPHLPAGGAFNQWVEGLQGR